MDAAQGVDLVLCVNVQYEDLPPDLDIKKSWIITRIGNSWHPQTWGGSNKNQWDAHSCPGVFLDPY